MISRWLIMGARKDGWSKERERPGCGMAPLH